MVDEKTVNVSLYDTAGNEEYARLRPIAYPQTDIFLLCFRINNKVSYENVRNVWVPEIRHHCPKVPYMIVGTMADLRSEEKMDKQPNSGQASMVSSEEGTKLAEQVGAVHYMECSAFTQVGLKQVFEKAIRFAVEP